MTKKRLNRTRRLVRPWQFRARDPKPRHLRTFSWFVSRPAKEVGNVNDTFSERQIAKWRANSTPATKELREHREYIVEKYG